MWRGAQHVVYGSRPSSRRTPAGHRRAGSGGEGCLSYDRADEYRLCEAIRGVVSDSLPFTIMANEVKIYATDGTLPGGGVGNGSLRRGLRPCGQSLEAITAPGPIMVEVILREPDPNRWISYARECGS